MAVIEIAMGLVVTELLQVVKEVMKEAGRYESVLKRMESTLISMKPIVEEIRMLNEVLACGDEGTKKLWEQIEKGEELVRKCKESSPSCCCFFKKADYIGELEALDKSLKSFFDTVLKAQQLRAERKTLENQTEMLGNQRGMMGNHGEMLDNQRGMLETQREMLENQRDIHGDVKIILGKLDDPERNKDVAMEVLNNTAPLRLCSPPDPPEPIVGLDKPLAELKNELLKEGLSLIVLSAPGGCGKTTLAKKLCQDRDVKGKFVDNIFFVTVSKTPNLKVIIQQLFLHNGYQVPEFQGDEDAVNRLGHLMRQIGQKPILLVLDDVWSGSDSFLDKFMFQLPNYKILVTSRSSWPRFHSTFKLDPLNEKDSMGLFRHSACLEDGSSNVVDEDVVNQVVRACKGFPLALTVVGKSLCGQPPEVWQKRVREWSRGGIFKSNVDLLNCLTSSLDALDNDVKECYMDLCSFPEGQLIPATALIDMWAELYKLDGDGRRSIANLIDMSNLNLVNLRKDAKEAEAYYDEHFVMQHDLLRELVNHLSGLDTLGKRKRIAVDIIGNEFPEWWKAQTQLNASLLSISTDETFSSNWGSIQATEVEAVVLNFRTKNYSLPMFLFNLDKLKALIITKYGFFPAEISNLSLVGYMSNLRRIRLEQVLIPSLTLISKKLVNLRKISIYRCKFGQASLNPDIQISEVFPNLVEIYIGDCTCLVDLPVGIFDLVYLKTLSITYCHDLTALPREVGNLENLELLRLRSCINLTELPDTIETLQKLNILDISDCLSIRKLPEQIGWLRGLKKLYMTGCSNCELPDPNSVAKQFQLSEVICDEETAKLWKPLKRHFSSLKIME